ncbi:MAG: adenylate/guanylate cyclase domain-containing protein, partial [Synechococcaceae cyanobacterium RL_1_2]|nr:adenylate/guanylate cyclase domain-containing protein [Synechococcaceae cyanobacterium RL_1_2]
MLPYCSLLAVTGGIRIHRRASVITTILAGLNFVYGAILFDLTNAVSGFALFTIVGTGLLGMLISNIVRRQGKNEAGRILMEQFLPSNVVEAAF